MLCYRLAIALNRQSGGHALANPVGLGALLLIGVLLATGTDYKQYFEGGKFIQMLLGPATVAPWRCRCTPICTGCPRCSGPC